MKVSTELLRALPKADLHCHLDGSIRLSTLLDLAQQQGIPLPANTAEGLQACVFKGSYANLEEYLAGFQYTVAVLRQAAALERVSYELAQDQYAMGVRYFEVRFAPQLLAVPGSLSMQQILHAVNAGLDRATEEWNAAAAIQSGEEPEYAYGIIVCAMRYFTPAFSPYYAAFWELQAREDPHRVYGMASMALVTEAVTMRDMGVPIVALDIAGAERGYPASDHIDAFAYAHKHFLHKTVHAGEGYGPASIYQALTDCHAERIGHGFHVFHASHVEHMKGEPAQRYVEQLCQYLGTMRICLEVCLSSNLQTIPEMQGDVTQHPIRKMLDAKLAVTLCTDNITVSRTTLVQELELAMTKLHLTAPQLKDIILTGFKRSFMPRPYVAKREYTHRIIAYYERVWAAAEATLSSS